LIPVAPSPATIGPVAPPLPTPQILSQRWRWASFLHWRVDPALVAPLLPHGTVPDEFDGSSWVGLIGFHLSQFAIRPGPPLPFFGDFPEINVRLYSVDADGNRGVVFRSLEATRLLTVLGARASLGVPYEWARISMHSASRRKGSSNSTGGSRTACPGPTSRSTPLLRNTSPGAASRTATRRCGRRGW
jgi:uncharacterized protein YqjF (DUF2071 family)